MPRVLVTSFEPFGGHAVNASVEVGRALAGSPPACGVIDWLVLPVVAGVCAERAWAQVEAARPDLVLALGQAGSTPHVRLEDRAVNFDFFHFPDNGGNLPRGQPVVPGGPAVLRTGVSLAPVIEEVRRTGLPIDLSFSAGSYVCNHYYYQLLHRAGLAAPSPRVLFVHLPLLPSQLTPGLRAFARPLEEQVACTRAVLEACLG